MWYIFLLVFGVAAFYIMRKEKSIVLDDQIDNSALEGKLLWYVFVTCLLSPFISQGIYYYGWKKKLPKKAKKANNIGWLAILLLLVLQVLFSFLVL